jgi:hypothetical protein
MLFNWSYAYYKWCVLYLLFHNKRKGKYKFKIFVMHYNIFFSWFLFGLRKCINAWKNIANFTVDVHGKIDYKNLGIFLLFLRKLGIPLCIQSTS